MKGLLGSIDASMAANWLLSHSASAAGKAGAAFVGGLLTFAVVGLLVFLMNVAVFVFMCGRRRCDWPKGHSKWAWLLAVPVGYTVSVAIPGFFVWLGLVVPVAYWLLVGRLTPSTG